MTRKIFMLDTLPVAIPQIGIGTKGNLTTYIISHCIYVTDLNMGNHENQK